MLRITHTTPNRLAAHLRRLQRDGQALLDLPRWLTPRDEALWDLRVWRCLDKIAHPDAFKGAMQRDSEEVGDIDLLDADRRPRSAEEMDDLLRRRINRRLGTVASVIEKVEAHAELLTKPARKRS